MPSRPLSKLEERALVKRVRKLKPRDHALVVAQLFLGFRISEILSLTVGHVLHHGRVRDRVALPPRFLKGGYGSTRSIPIGHEVRRALERYLNRRARRETLQNDAPLFVSRQRDSNGNRSALCRSAGEKIIKAALIEIAPQDPQGLSTHSLRKTFSARIYEESGHDILCVRDALGHSSVAVTQVYLPVNRSKIDALILRSDWTRRRAKPRAVSKPKPDIRAPKSKSKSREPITNPVADFPSAPVTPVAKSAAELYLPGFEPHAA